MMTWEECRVGVKDALKSCYQSKLTSGFEGIAHELYWIDSLFYSTRICVVHTDTVEQFVGEELYSALLFYGLVREMRLEPHP